MSKVSIIILCLLIVSCSRKSEIISSNNVKSITILLNDTNKSKLFEITNINSITNILRKLNNAHQEPIKFYATHHISVYYENGKQISVLCSGASMRVEGHTYKLQERINEILDNYTTMPGSVK